MATERQSPDTILAITELIGVVGDIQDDPDSPDGNWLVATGNNVNTDVRTSLPTPTGNPTVGGDLQEFRVLVRQYDEGQSGVPEARIELWENGGLIRAGSDTIVPLGGTVLSLTWNANELGTADGSLVECKVVGTKAGGGPTKRNTVDVGAVEWNVTYTPGGVTHEGSATLSGVGTLGAKGALTAAGKATLAGTGLLAANGVITATGKATMSGEGSLAALARLTLAGKAALAGTGSLTAIGRRIVTGATSLSGVGSLSSIGRTIVAGKATLVGIGSLASKGVMTVAGKATLVGTGTLAAIGTVISGGGKKPIKSSIAIEAMATGVI